MQVGDFNVIRVDWRGGSQTIDYPQAANDIQVVGAEIGLFIENIIVRKDSGMRTQISFKLVQVRVQ